MVNLDIPKKALAENLNTRMTAMDNLQKSLEELEQQKAKIIAKIEQASEEIDQIVEALILLGGGQDINPGQDRTTS